MATVLGETSDASCTVELRQAANFFDAEVRQRAAAATLMPNAGAENETRVIDDPALFTREGGGLIEHSRVRESDVGCELPADLVADTKARIELGQQKRSGPPSALA